MDSTDYKKNNKIDFVITWVDGNDEKWIKDKENYLDADKKNKNNVRYREWDNLQYWFRGVEKHAAWVNKIHFVTYGHLPQWLNVDHPKLNIVKHEDYIPKEFLPTFSSHPIEIHLHRIKGLSDQFVYFNDDMFITNEVKESDFFYNGLPRDSAILNALISHKDGVSSIINNNMEIINTYFNKNEQISKNTFRYFNMKYKTYNLRTLFLMPWKHFPGFYEPHLPISLMKNTFIDIWDFEKELLNNISRNKFRTKNDVNSWLFRYWQLASGNFIPRNISIGQYYYLGNNNEEIFNALKSKKYRMVCLNDNGDIENFEKQKQILKNTFENIFPRKSSFEI